MIYVKCVVCFVHDYRYADGSKTPTDVEPLVVKHSGDKVNFDEINKTMNALHTDHNKDWIHKVQFHMTVTNSLE